MAPADLEFPALPRIKAKSEASEASGMTGGSGSEDEDGYCTPRSARHMIPAVVSRPPAPKKRRRTADQSPEKVDLFEIIDREEIESLFRMVDAVRSTTPNGA